MVNQDMLMHLPVADQRLLRTLSGLVAAGGETGAKIVAFMRAKMGERSTLDWEKLPKDLEEQACFDYMVIGLMTGEITKDDLQKLVP